jgi:hypothetical protein
MSDPTLKATVCPQCGAPAAPGEGFCRNCGKQLFAPTITAPPPVVRRMQTSPVDTGRQEWIALNLEYGSTFQAWRTWLLARGALGLTGAESTTVRDVDALYIPRTENECCFSKKVLI